MLAAKLAAASSRRESSAAPSVKSVSIADDAASEAPSEAPSKLSILRRASGWGSLATKMKSKSAAPLKRYENTYRVEPDPDHLFDCAKVEKFVTEILDSRLKGQSYKGNICRSLTSTLSDVIKGRVKKMGFPRHKIIVHTVLGEKLRHDIQVCSRSVWNDKTDSHVTVTYENGSLYAVVTIYAVYFE